MTKRVEIISKQEIFKKFIFRIEEAHLRHERFDGSMSQEIVRLNLNRGDSTAVVLHDKRADTLVMTEQFRYPTYEKGPGWLLELPAGVVEQGEDPADTMRREMLEETGYAVQTVRHIGTFYLSPGGSSERIVLYYANATPQNQVARGGGVISEGEDIRVLVLKVDDVLKKIASGEIADAKTMVGLQWLQLNRASL